MKPVQVRVSYNPAYYDSFRNLPHNKVANRGMLYGVNRGICGGQLGCRRMGYRTYITPEKLKHGY